MNNGCQGGHVYYSLQHANSTKIVNQEQYSYTGVRGSCEVTESPVDNQFNCDLVKADENYLAYLLNNNGPIVVILATDSDVFKSYKGGVLRSDNCGTKVIQQTLLVGIGEDSISEYWIIKNSWGTKWGENGFIRIAKGKNIYGIVAESVTLVSYNQLIKS